MKIIRSNPWGFGIHSPFVYRLVTKIIFGKPDSSSEQISFPAGIKPADKKKISRILRLTRFFKPQKIKFLKVNNPVEKVIRDHFREESIDREEKAGNPDGYHEMVIGFDPSSEKVPVEGSIWFLPDLQLPGCKDFFLNLQKNPQVTITIEVNHTGLIISNKKYQKQNFYIRKWFSL